MSNKGSTRLGKNPTVAGEWGVLQIVQEFVDKGISGAKGREQRPAFHALWKGVIRTEFDVGYGWSIGWAGPLHTSSNFLTDPREKG